MKMAKLTASRKWICGFFPFFFLQAAPPDMEENEKKKKQKEERGKRKEDEINRNKNDMAVFA